MVRAASLLNLIAVLLMGIPVLAFSQNITFSGQIINATSAERITYASVFLSNSSYGTQSGADGAFVFRNVKPGQYELIVKYVGYETYQQVIMVDEQLPPLTIKLVPKIQQLQEVVVRPNLNRERDLAIFKREFIGNSDAALKFRIMNPEALTISYREGKLLEASSDDFLILENKHLGYKISYLLNEFTKTFIPDSFGAGMIYYEGASLFENLKGNRAQEKRWKKNRLNAYQGSGTHFYRSLLSNTTQQEGFVMYRLIKKDNPDRPSDQLIESKLQRFNQGSTLSNKINRDSLDYWYNKKNLPRQIQYLLKDSIRKKDIFFRTEKSDLFAARFPNCLYVTYKGRNPSEAFSDVYKPLNLGDVQVSVITLTGDEAIFDQNGIIVNARNVIYEGAWAEAKIPFMLPYDYRPGD
jgi:hypothetical protein